MPRTHCFANILDNRYVILACGTVVLVVMGLIYAWSIFVAPLEDEFGWTRSETSFTFSVSMVMWSFGMLACGQLTKRLSKRACFAIGACLIACGFVLTSRTHELWQLYVCYGVFCGFRTGLCYNLWTSATLAHFPDRTGFASGVLLMGFGMGAMLLGSAAAGIVHSDIGWRGAFIVLALVVVAVAAASMPFIRTPSERNAAAKPKHATQGCELTGTQLVKEPSFWTYTVWKVLTMGAAGAIISQAAPMMAAIGTDAALSTIAVGAISIGNGCGRPIVGAVYDVLGRERTLVLLPVCGVVIGVLMCAAYACANFYALAANLFAEGVLYGGYAAINTSFIPTTFGRSHMATNLGISSFTLMPFNAAAPVVCAAAYMATGSYAAFLYALAPIAAISLAAAFVTNPLVRKMVQRDA